METKILTKKTIEHYETDPLGFWRGTFDHDVSQNYQALLGHLEHSNCQTLLDLGCGPGRDLKYFKQLGHHVIGLDGCESFCQMARDYSGCEVLQQDFIEINLKENYFNGIFANASLFHVPKINLPEVLAVLQRSLKQNGILFSSNPRGDGESINGSRYANLMELNEYQTIVEMCGFELIDHYYRPQSVPLENRPWLACVFKKT